MYNYINIIFLVVPRRETLVGGSGVLGAQDAARYVQTDGITVTTPRARISILYHFVYYCTRNIHWRLQDRVLYIL